MAKKSEKKPLTEDERISAENRERLRQELATLQTACKQQGFVLKIYETENCWLNTIYNQKEYEDVNVTQDVMGYFNGVPLQQVIRRFCERVQTK
ncbi:MAG TPA: hypothetical protein VHP11_09975 [Tepidisphaeraceae bacterium]|nr:hypothetical protein [Tepidisphaeraceae bacterium]